MPKQSTVSMSWIFPLVATILMVSFLQAQDTPADHFAKGKKLIEDNCVDCMDGTQKGEEEGIRELETALQAHYAKPVDAYKLLADAYANMSSYVQKNQSDSQAFQHMEYDVYRKLYELAPDDEQVLMDYSLTLTEAKDQIAICRKILSLNPKNADARFSLGELLVRQDKVKQGVEEMKQGLALESDPEGECNFVQRVIEALSQHHCPLKHAVIYNAEALKAEEAATQGPGDPQPMAIFKRKFVAAMEQHVCTEPAANPKSR